MRKDWSLQERTFICVLWRFYSRSPYDFAAVFNEAFGLALKVSKIRAQFDDMRYYGGDKFPIFSEVNSVLVDDPEGHYQDWRNVIEAAARGLGIALHRIQEEETSTSGRSTHARDKSTYKKCRTPIRKAEIREERKRHVPQSGLSTHGASFSTKPEFMKYSPICSRDVPALGYRVWDSESKTIFDKRGFVSQMFSQWTGPCVEPFSEGHGQQALLLLTHSHMSPRGPASKGPASNSAALAFVSLTTSLLQALVMASKMKRPRIAVLDLNHKLLKESGKIHYAGDIIRFLKANKLAPYSYKGRAGKSYAIVINDLPANNSVEYIVFADIPQDVILHQFPIWDLISLHDEDKTCADILDSTIFVPKQSTPAAALKL